MGRRQQRSAVAKPRRDAELDDLLERILNLEGKQRNCASLLGIDRYEEQLKVLRQKYNARLEQVKRKAQT